MRTDYVLRVKLWCLCAALVVGPALAVGATEATLEVQVSERAVTVGDSIPIRVLARGPGELMWGELTARIGNDSAWAVTDGPHEVPGSSPPAWDLTLVPLKVGELDLPDFEAGARAKDGDPISVEAEPGTVVTVASVLGPEDQGEPAPLKDPLGVQGFPWEWVLPIAAGVLPVVALIAWLWRRRRKAVESAAAPRMTPVEEFEQLLADLEQRIGREPAGVVCDRLASGVRHYLERRTGEPAAEMTSHELQVLSRRSGWPGDVQSALLKVTRVADGVRFGRTPTLDRDLGGARELALALCRSLEVHLTPVAAEGEEVA